MPSKEEESLRVIVAVTRDGHPELFDELAKIPAKFRAERLRTMGLMSLRGSAAPLNITALQAHTAMQATPISTSAGSGEDGEAVERERQEEEALRKRKLALKNDLKKSF